MNLFQKIFQQEDLGSELHSGEAYVLWTQVQARYDGLEMAEIFINFADDTDLKALIETGLTTVIYPQIKKLEDFMTHYKIPLPPRPPKNVNIIKNTQVFRDEGIFRTIYDTSQAALLVHSKAINICTNDLLRKMFANFLNDEIQIQDNLVKYGIIKGWIHSAPAYNV